MYAIWQNLIKLIIIVSQMIYFYGLIVKIDTENVAYIYNGILFNVQNEKYSDP